MQMEQPDTQDSGTAAPQPDDINDQLEHNPVDADNDDADPDLETQEEDEEIEVDGRKFALPKSAAEKLKAERLMHADYTQKTQAVAAERKAIEAQREEVQRQQQEAQQYLDDMAEIRSIDKQLAQYKALDWRKLIEEAPQTAMLYQQQQRDLEALRGEKAQSITQKQNEHALNEQQATAKRVQEAEAYLAREIPGITPERLAAIEQYAATKHGIDKQRFSAGVINSPFMAVVLDKARMFDELQAKQAKPKTAAPPPAPVTRVGSTRASSAKDPGKMSTAEWMAQRSKQVSKR